MKNIEIYNTLNIDKDSSSIVATFTQEDDAVMEFKLFKDGQEIVLKDQTISLGAERKDGAVIEQDDGFLIKENNVLNITLKKNIIQVVGVVKIQLYLKDKNGEMASNTFNIRVNKKLLGAENVEATNDIKSLNTLVLELKNNTNKLIDDTKSKADKLLSGLQETGDNLSSTVKAKTDKIIEDTKAEVDNIKKDYEGLKKVVIDENIGIKLQKDVTELQNGLKSNQSLAYQGSSISAKDTLEGRTEGMRIVGRTLVNLKGNVKNRVSTWVDNDDKYTLNLESGHGQPSILYNLTHVLKENQKYTVIVNLVEYTSGVLHFSFMNSDGNKLASTTELVAESKGLKKFVFTINNTVKAETLRLLPRNGINNIYSISKNILILEGDWTNKEIPSFFEGLKSFGEVEKVEDKYKISILSHGKNLLKPPSSDITKRQGTCDITLTKDGGFIINGFNSTTGGGRHLFSDIYLYKVTKGVSYTLSCIHVSGTSTDQYSPTLFLTNINNHSDIPASINTISSTKKTTFVADKDMILFCGVNVNIDQSYNNYEIKVMLEESKNVTQYETYKENKKDILIKEPLRNIGNIQDILYEDNGQVKINRYVKEYTFTGDEILRKSNTYGDVIRFDYKLTNLKFASDIICNNFAKGTIGKENLECINVHSNDNLVQIQINANKLETQDVEGFRKWLKANPTTIVYQLATPTVEIVENCVDIDLDTYQDKTYFSINNTIPGSLDFKVPSNIASIVQNTAREVNNIWDVINNLLVPSILDVNKKVALATIKNNLK
ncbi:hypothetical protein P5E75_09460 [Clostridium perfringens]|nr:hypothetical protein [Clostridium perfringens]